MFSKKIISFVLLEVQAATVAFHVKTRLILLADVYFCLSLRFNKISENRSKTEWRTQITEYDVSLNKSYYCHFTVYEGYRG